MNPGSSPASPRPGLPAQVDFGRIGAAFNIVKDNWQPFVVGGLLFAVAVGVAYGLAVVLMTVVATLLPEGAAFIAMMVTMLLLVLLVFVFSAVFQVGMMNMALKSARGEPVAMGDLMVAMKNPFPYMIAGVLVGLGVMIGSVCFYIPGLIFAGLSMFTFPLMLERQMAPMDAIKQSIELAKPQWLMLTLFYLVAAIVGQLGSIACGVGVLFTIPVMFVSLALVYRDFSGSQ